MSERGGGAGEMTSTSCGLNTLVWLCVCAMTRRSSAGLGRMQLDVVGFGQLTHFLTGFSFAYCQWNEFDAMRYIYSIMMSAH